MRLVSDLSQPATLAGADDPAILAACAEAMQLGGPVLWALRHSGTAMVLTDPRLPDNPIIEVNDAFTRLTGHAAAAVRGRNCRLLQGPETDPATVAAIAAALREGRAINTELLNYRADGSTFWNGLCLTPVPDAQGRPRFYLGTQADVSRAHCVGSAEATLRTQERALDVARERLRLALSIAGAAAAWEWCIPERRIIGDERFAALYGLSEEDAAAGVAPVTFFSIIHPDDVPRIRLAVGGMLRGAEVFSKAYRVLLADGDCRWVQASGRCATDAAGLPHRFFGVLVDITEQKRIEEQLRIAQTAGGIGTFEFTYGFATVAVSRHFCNLLGLYPSAELPVATINGVVCPDHRPVVAMQTSARAGDVARREFRIQRPDNGELRWLMLRGEYLRDSGTADLRLSGVIYDITEAKRVEAQLRSLNETLESRVEERTRERDRLWRLSSDPFLVADAEGRWLSANPAWTELLGWPEASLLGRTCAWLEHPDDTVSTQAALTAGPAERRFEGRLRTASGDYRWLSWTAVAEAGLLYCVARDITAEKAQAMALAEAEARLRQSQKMEAVGQLTGGLAHDFNNLLTGVTASLEMMRTRISQGRYDALERYIAAAKDAASRAAALTHRLLAFSRRQTLAPKSVEANRLITGMEDLVRRTMGPEIEITTRLAPGLWLTLCDPHQLENALLNLCINARDAMPGGGRLTIATGNAELADGAARARDLRAGQYVEVSVADTGTGMAPETAARAFDPFFTTKSLGQGTGLGLSMIYGFVKQSGGQVGLVSRLGAGTKVTLLLPRYQGPSLGEAAPAAPAYPPRARPGESILVVDDEATIRMLVADALRDRGYAVMEAADGIAALEVIRQDIALDLLVTDVGMPGGLNGRQLAEAARALRPGLKVLLITGYAEQAVVGDAALDRGMEVMTKPFALDALGMRIRGMIDAPRG